MVYAMVVPKKENLRTRLDDVRKNALNALCERKKISLQDAMEALVDFLLEQDDVTQSVVLGQIEEISDRKAVAEMVLNRMADRPKPKGRRI